VDSLRRNKAFIISFLLPAFLVYTLLAVIPIIQSVYFSFFSWPGISKIPMKFVGLANFKNMLSSAGFWLSIKNVLWFIFLNLIFQIAMGYGLAILLVRCWKGYKAFKVAFFFPVVLPLTASALLWKFIYFPNDIGVLNQFLMFFGLDKLTTAWLVNSKTALNAVIAANVWTGFGYHVVIGFAALLGIPDEIMESAALDGANGFQRLVKFTLPMIWEAIKISVVLIITGSMKNFDIVFVMTEGGPNGLTHVPSTLLYYEAFKYDHYGLGSAIAVFIFVVSLFLALISLRLMQREAIEY
jgi:raffinose/stachyose/melibiose transport system permease protein